ncbi:MAG: aldo/keto reductase, partial [Bacteroidota bacterium]
MEIRTLGPQGPSVSRIGLGLAALGRPGYINLGHAQDLQQDYVVEKMQNRSAEVMDAAWAAGIRYYDTARSYGRGEAFLGHWLRSRGRQAGEVAIGSKWGYTYTADWQVEAEYHEIKEHTLPILTRQWQETQVEIGPWLDLYQIHSATLDSGVLERSEVLTELARLKGKGTRIGLSLSGPGQAATLEKAMTIQVDGELLFDGVQATWNLLERSAGPTLQAAHEAGLGVIIKEALANGRLTARNTASDFANSRQM